MNNFSVKQEVWLYDDSASGPNVPRKKSVFNIHDRSLLTRRARCALRALPGYILPLNGFALGTNPLPSIFKYVMEICTPGLLNVGKSLAEGTCHVGMI